MSTTSSPDAVAALPGEELAQHPDFVKLTAARQAPQAAMRARLNAVILDLVMLGLVSQLLGAVLGTTKGAQDRTWTFLAVEFIYFFAFELGGGRTIGKRVFHVRVVTASGAPASARQIAVRNLLRVVDALPLLYASGLISMMRTGPGRRQRIGDVAAGTTVLLDAQGRALHTPRWLLPVATLLTTLVSLAVVIPLVANSHPGPGPAPVEGVWQAYGAPVGPTGHAGALATAKWMFETQCPPGGTCGLFLVFQTPGANPVSARLVRTSRAWLATFPVISVRCGEEPDGRPAYLRVRAVIAMRFRERGLAGEGEERERAESARCGNAVAGQRWTASYVGVG